MLFLLTNQDVTWASPIINIGAVGVCLVALAIWYIRKDAKSEKRMDERIAQEEQFRKEKSDLYEAFRHETVELAEKYRVALEKFSQTLDSIVRLLSKKNGGP